MAQTGPGMARSDPATWRLPAPPCPARAPCPRRVPAASRAWPAAGARSRGPRGRGLAPWPASTPARPGWQRLRREAAARSVASCGHGDSGLPARLPQRHQHTAADEAEGHGRRDHGRNLADDAQQKNLAADEHQRRAYFRPLNTPSSTTSRISWPKRQAWKVTPTRQTVRMAKRSVLVSMVTLATG